MPRSKLSNNNGRRVRAKKTNIKAIHSRGVKFLKLKESSSVNR